MTVIDVKHRQNTPAPGGNLEETVSPATNLEAGAEEIVRQLRLRDLGASS